MISKDESIGEDCVTTFIWRIPFMNDSSSSYPAGMVEDQSIAYKDGFH